MYLIDGYDTLPRYNDPKAATTISSCLWRGGPTKSSNSCRCSLASECTALPVCYGMHFQEMWRCEYNDHTPEHPSQIRWAHSLSSHSPFYLFGPVVHSWSMGPKRGYGALKTAMKHYRNVRNNLEIIQNGRRFIGAPIVGASLFSILVCCSVASKILSPSFRS